MASSLLDVCRFNPAAGGTTDWTYSSAVTGYQSPTAAGAVNGAIYSYRAESNDLSQWEEGYGAYNSSTGVFARTTVLYNSSGTGTGPGQSGAGTKIAFSTVPQVAIVALAEDLLLFNAAMSLTTGQQLQARTNIGIPSNFAPFATGVLTTFQQTTAPTGWTKQTTHNDKSLRVVSGTASSGGTNAFSTVNAQTTVGNTTLSTAQMPAHSHSPASPVVAYVAWYNVAGHNYPIPTGAGALQLEINGGGLANNGSSSAHNHGITMDIQYVDLIIASKD
jgi:hypothetical protein